MWQFVSSFKTWLTVLWSYLDGWWNEMVMMWRLSWASQVLVFLIRSVGPVTHYNFLYFSGIFLTKPLNHKSVWYSSMFFTHISKNNRKPPKREQRRPEKVHDGLSKGHFIAFYLLDCTGAYFVAFCPCVETQPQINYWFNHWMKGNIFRYIKLKKKKNRYNNIHFWSQVAEVSKKRRNLSLTKWLSH